MPPFDLTDFPIIPPPGFRTIMCATTKGPIITIGPPITINPPVTQEPITTEPTYTVEPVTSEVL